VKKTVLLYGLVGGLIIAGLRFAEYRFVFVENSLEIYAGIIATLFAVLGIWLGLKLTRKTIVVKEVPVPVEVVVPSEPFVRNTTRQQQLGITPRELEILELIAAGLSNREISQRLYVSENTVKTHSGRVLEKLSARRRTHAVQLAKEARLIP